MFTDSFQLLYFLKAMFRPVKNYTSLCHKLHLTCWMYINNIVVLAGRQKWKMWKDDLFSYYIYLMLNNNLFIPYHYLLDCMSWVMEEIHTKRVWMDLLCKYIVQTARLIHRKKIQQRTKKYMPKQLLQNPLHFIVH